MSDLQDPTNFCWKSSSLNEELVLGKQGGTVDLLHHSLYLGRYNLSAMSSIIGRGQRHTKEVGGGVAKEGYERRT